MEDVLSDRILILTAVLVIELFRLSSLFLLIMAERLCSHDPFFCYNYPSVENC